MGTVREKADEDVAEALEQLRERIAERVRVEQIHDQLTGLRNEAALTATMSGLLDRRRRFVRTATSSTCSVNGARAGRERRDSDSPHRLIAAERTPFEHIIVASGDPVLGTLDLAWVLADVDVWTFRLTRLWDGPAFTAIAGCGAR